MSCELCKESITDLRYLNELPDNEWNAFREEFEYHWHVSKEISPLSKFYVYVIASNFRKNIFPEYENLHIKKITKNMDTTYDHFYGKHNCIVKYS